MKRVSYQSSLFTLKNFLILYGFIALNKLYSEWLHNKMLSKYNSDKKLKRDKPENLTRGREGVKAGGKPSSCLVSFLNIPSPFTHPLPPPDNRGEVLAPAKRPRVGGEDLDSERGNPNPSLPRSGSPSFWWRRPSPMATKRAYKLRILWIAGLGILNRIIRSRIALPACLNSTS